MRVLYVACLSAIASSALANGGAIPADVASGKVRGEGKPTPALLLARLCVSEEDWNLSGCNAIWRTIENVRSKNCELGTECGLDGRETFRSALTRMSGRIAGVKPVLNHRQEWVVQLSKHGERPPAWVECPSQGRCDGVWEVYRPKWLKVLGRARKLLLEGTENPCESQPLAWGGEMDKEFMFRRNVARVRGGKRPLREIQCDGTKNTFYGLSFRGGEVAKDG